MQTKWICATLYSTLFVSERPCPTLRIHFFPGKLLVFWMGLNQRLLFFFSTILCATLSPLFVPFFSWTVKYGAHSHIEWESTHHIYRFWMFQIYGISTHSTHTHVYTFIQSTFQHATHIGNVNSSLLFLSLTFSLGSSFFYLIFHFFRLLLLLSLFPCFCCHSCCFHFTTEADRILQTAVWSKHVHFIRPCRKFS